MNKRQNWPIGTSSENKIYKKTARAVLFLSIFLYTVLIKCNSSPSSMPSSLASSFDSTNSENHVIYSRLHSLFSLTCFTSASRLFVNSLWINSSFRYAKNDLRSADNSPASP